MGRETKAAKRARAVEIIQRLRRIYPDSRCSLDFGDPWQLLVAVILSAQCTDERVNQITPGLFRRWPTALAMAEAPLGEIERVVRPTGFFRNKARHIQRAARQVVADFGGEVPRTMPELLELAGVARKTANVVLHTAYGAPNGAGAGVCVDTHVTRLANRLRLCRATRDPKKIEADLQEVVPEEHWGLVTHLLIDHGRAVCSGRTTPRCDGCVLNDVCPSAFRF